MTLVSMYSCMSSSTCARHVYKCTYMYTLIHTCIYTYTHKHIHEYTYSIVDIIIIIWRKQHKLRMHTCIYTYKCIRTHIYTYYHLIAKSILLGIVKGCFTLLRLIIIRTIHTHHRKNKTSQITEQGQMLYSYINNSKVYTYVFMYVCMKARMFGSKHVCSYV